QTSRRADAPRCAANVMGRGRRCACGHRGDRDRLIALIRPLSRTTRWLAPRRPVCACSIVALETDWLAGRRRRPGMIIIKEIVFSAENTRGLRREIRWG